eukprot:GHVS01016477.1.p1 GENE.GHVS01016477.1~~GHVS01016477.1.p1  ORF type:complete len:183 (-),score=30.01 GHVS01016477.1:353-901(-)
MAPRVKQPSGGVLCGCCSPKKKGSGLDAHEIVVESGAKDAIAALPSQLKLIDTNSVVEIQPGKEELGKISFRPRADTMYDSSSNSLLIIMALPGFVKDEVEIEIEKGVLVVSGECRKATPVDRYGETLEAFVRELQFGHFSRCFRLPPNVLEDSVEATMHDGLIEIKIKCVNAGEKKRVTLT